MSGLARAPWRVASRILVLVGLALPLARTQAQMSNAFTACGTGPLVNCAVVQLTTQLGVGSGGTNLVRIALQNLGSSMSPGTPTSIYNLIFATGQLPAGLGTEVDVTASPVASGGATVTDPSPWSVFDSGDAIFLSALGNSGVGGCVAGVPIGGFGQIGQTCGGDQFISFSFFTPRTYDLTAFTLLDMEVVGLDNALDAESCGSGNPCTISAAPVTATPEPGTLVLAITGLSGIAGSALRHRMRGGRSVTEASEEIA